MLPPERYRRQKAVARTGESQKILERMWILSGTGKLESRRKAVFPVYKIKFQTEREQCSARIQFM